MLESDGAKCPHFPTGGMRLNHLLPPARRSDPFGPACLPAGRLDDFKFFVPLLVELRASLGLAANLLWLAF